MTIAGSLPTSSVGASIIAILGSRLTEVKYPRYGTTASNRKRAIPARIFGQQASYEILLAPLSAYLVLAQSVQVGHGA